MGDDDPELRDQVAAAVQRDIARHGGTPGMLLQEFVVVAHLTGWDEDGRTVSQVTILPVDGAVHRIRGLLLEAQDRFQAETLQTYTDWPGGEGG